MFLPTEFDQKSLGLQDILPTQTCSPKEMQKKMSWQLAFLPTSKPSRYSHEVHSRAEKRSLCTFTLLSLLTAHPDSAVKAQ